MSRLVKVVLAVVVVVAVLVGVGIWWFFKDDAPPEVDLADAVASVTTTGDAAAAVDDLNGTWTVEHTGGVAGFD
jgi:hypothetical protein